MIVSPLTPTSFSSSPTKVTTDLIASDNLDFDKAVLILRPSCDTLGALPLSRFCFANLPSFSSKFTVKDELTIPIPY